MSLFFCSAAMLFERFLWRGISQTCHEPTIKMFLYDGDVVVVIPREITALRDEFSDGLVGVLNTTFFPGMVGMAEIYLYFK